MFEYLKPKNGGSVLTPCCSPSQENASDSRETVGDDGEWQALEGESRLSSSLGTAWLWAFPLKNIFTVRPVNVAAFATAKLVSFSVWNGSRFPGISNDYLAVAVNVANPRCVFRGSHGVAILASGGAL
jgi:hypothetical protein